MIQDGALIFLGVLLTLGGLGVNVRLGPLRVQRVGSFFPGTKYYDVFSDLGWLNPI